VYFLCNSPILKPELVFMLNLFACNVQSSIFTVLILLSWISFQNVQRRLFIAMTFKILYTS